MTRELKALKIGEAIVDGELANGGQIEVAHINMAGF